MSLYSGIALFVLYIPFFLLFVDEFGGVIGGFIIIPVALITRSVGLFRGYLVWIISAIVNAILVATQNLSADSINLQGYFFGTIFVGFTVFIVGSIRDTELKVGNERYKLAKKNQILELQRKKLNLIENELLKSESSLAAIISNSPIIIWALDQNGDFTVIQGKGLELFDLSQNQVVGRNITEFKEIIPKAVKASFQAIDGHDGVENIDVNNLSFEAHFMSITSTDGENGMIGIALDITERHKTQEEAKLSESRYRLFVENTLQAIYMCNLDNLEIVEANKKFFELTGYSQEDLATLSVYDFIHHERSSIDTYAVQTWKQDSLEIGERQWKRKDGTIIDVHVSAFKFDYYNEKFVYIVAQDLTEQKLSEVEKNNLQAQIQHSQKLESLGVLAGGIAHDFNNILMGILSRSSLGLRQLDENTDLYSNISKIVDSSKKAADLVKQLLAYTGKGRIELQSTNIQHLIEDMNDLVGILVPNPVDIEYILDENLPNILVDQTQMRQVVINLLTNAAESIQHRQDGKIIVRTKSFSYEKMGLEAGNSYLFGEFKSGTDYLIIEVEDNGEGIEHAVLENIFDPFFSSKYAGRGLGLAVVSGIVKTHGGMIFVKSEVNLGSSFQIILPVTYVEKVTEEKQEAPKKQNRIHFKKKILICDDESVVRTVLTAMLKYIDPNVGIMDAEDGEAGYKLFKFNQHDLDLAILDITMPKITGYELM